MKEFELIRHYFQEPAQGLLEAVPPDMGQWTQGMGDDCAIWHPLSGQALLVSTDILIAGRHFLEDTDPQRLGHKALAVNLSDLAACGAQPVGFTLGLALPGVDSGWLQGFSKGLLASSRTYACPLVGGDTTQMSHQGPLTITITVWGQSPRGQALLRRGAQVGDDIYVTGTLGEAAWALGALQGRWIVPPEQFEMARKRLEWPVPRLAMGQALRGLASAAIDLSDGLHGDIQHVLKASEVGAYIDVGALYQQGVIHTALWHCDPGGSLERALFCAFGGGDDYELLFTASPQNRVAIEMAGARTGTPVARIGQVTFEPGIRYGYQGVNIEPYWQAFEHF
jgi:thiamine-monophosphate kinase